MTKLKPKILMIENDADDRALTAELFETQNLDAQNEFLNTQDFQPRMISDAIHTDLILLSVPNARSENFSLIPVIKKNPLISGIPVVVLTDETDDTMIQQLYQAGANTVIQKPSGLNDTVYKIRSFFEYWFRVAILPQA